MARSAKSVRLGRARGSCYLQQWNHHLLGQLCPRQRWLGILDRRSVAGLGDEAGIGIDVDLKEIWSIMREQPLKAVFVPMASDTECYCDISKRFRKPQPPLNARRRVLAP